MRLIVDLCQTAQGRLEGTVARPGSAATTPFVGIVELVGVLERHLGTDPEDSGGAGGSDAGRPRAAQ